MVQFADVLHITIANWQITCSSTEYYTTPFKHTTDIHSLSGCDQKVGTNNRALLVWCDKTKKTHLLAVMRLSLKLTCCVSCQVMSTANWLPCIARSPRHPSTAAFSFPPAACLCTLSCSAAPCSCCRCAASCPWSSSSVPVQRKITVNYAPAVVTINFDSFGA